MAATHLIVGAGNMGGALMASWLSAGLIGPRQLCILDPNPSTDAVFAIERGARHLGAAVDIPRSVTTVLIAVKPQQFDSLRAQLEAAVPASALILSIMAGIPLARLQNAFPGRDVVRAMPNTPASIGEGMSAFVAPDEMPAKSLDRVTELLGASGQVLQVESDSAIDAVTAISGSGPAYLFHMTEALEAAARSLGFDEHSAANLARQTVIGASALLKTSERSAGDLREAVTSPGGTTQAALDILMGADGLSPLMRRATQAALERSQQLSR